jgi:hypothetical protein
MSGSLPIASARRRDAIDVAGQLLSCAAQQFAGQRARMARRRRTSARVWLAKRPGCAAQSRPYQCNRLIMLISTA